MPTDVVRLIGLRVMAHCGALAEEQQRAQPFELDVDLELDAAPAGLSDNLVDTIDYGEVCEALAGTLEAERYTLLERMAQRAAEVCLAFDSRALAVTVHVRKLRPPVPRHLQASAVRITRRR